MNEREDVSELVYEYFSTCRINGDGRRKMEIPKGVKAELSYNGLYMAADGDVVCLSRMSSLRRAW
jgi:hypothetical protein